MSKIDAIRARWCGPEPHDDLSSAVDDIRWLLDCLEGASDSGFDPSRRVFSHWQESFKRERARIRSGDGRDKKIRARLKEFSEKEVIDALSGFSMDPWRKEAPARHELATLLRNSAQVEVGLELFATGGGRRSSNSANSYGRPSGNSTVDFRREGGFSVPEPVQGDAPQWEEVSGDGHVVPDLF